MSCKAGEARVYWVAVESARRARQARPTCDISEQQDDLEVLLIHSNWPAIRNKATAFLADTKEQRLANSGC
jgi:hypothetical protein